jgi:hypothetical protein
MVGSFAWRLLFAARKKERAEEDQEVYEGLQASRDNLRRIREQICAKRDAEIAAGVFEESDDEEELEDNSEGEKTVEAGEPEGVAEEEKEESQKTEETNTEEPKTEEPNSEEVNTEDVESQEGNDDDDSDSDPPEGF